MPVWLEKGKIGSNINDSPKDTPLRMSPRRLSHQA